MRLPAPHRPQTLHDLRPRNTVLPPGGTTIIPKHLIDKAVNAAGDNWVMVFDWEHDKIYAQVHAALEAVAADIWDEGFEVGEGNGYAIGRDIDTDEDTTNPYRNEPA